MTVLFCLMVFAVPWVLLLLLHDVRSVGGLLAWLFPTVWTPTLAAIALTWWTGGTVAVSRELRDRLRYRAGIARWIGTAACVALVTSLVAVIAARAAGNGAAFISGGGIPMMVTLQVATGAVGEELGWRGYLVPRLRAHFGAVFAAWIMGVLWSAWHIAAFFFPLTAHAQIIPMVPNLLMTGFFGVFLAFLFERSGDSVLPTMSGHLALNIMSGVGGVRLSSTVYWWVLIGIFALIAIAVTFLMSASRTDLPSSRMSVRAT